MRTATIKFLTLQETTRLFHRLASYRREKAIFLLAYRHGLRASEVGMLRIEDMVIYVAGYPAIMGLQPLYFRDAELARRARIPAESAQTNLRQ